MSTYRAYRTDIRVKSMSVFERGIDWADNIIKTKPGIVL